MAGSLAGLGQLYKPAFRARRHLHWQQLPDGRIALGGFRDKGGEGEWTTDGTPSAVVQAHLERFLRESLKVQAPITHRWGAPVGYTPTGLPVIAEARDGVWALGGYSGTGNVIGALAARAVVEAAIDGDERGVRLLQRTGTF